MKMFGKREKYFGRGRVGMGQHGAVWFESGALHEACDRGLRVRVVAGEEHLRAMRAADALGEHRVERLHDFRAARASALPHRRKS